LLLKKKKRRRRHLNWKRSSWMKRQENWGSRSRILKNSQWSTISSMQKSYFPDLHLLRSKQISLAMWSHITLWNKHSEQMRMQSLISLQSLRERTLWLKLMLVMFRSSKLFILQNWKCNWMKSWESLEFIMSKQCCLSQRCMSRCFARLKRTRNCFSEMDIQTSEESSSTQTQVENPWKKWSYSPSLFLQTSMDSPSRKQTHLRIKVSDSSS